MEGVVSVNVMDETKYDENNIMYVTMQTDAFDIDKRWYASYNSPSNEAQCSCRGFETKGLLCRHILRIYNLKNVRQIPSQYVLKRYTVSAKKGIYLSDTPSITDYDSNLIFRNHLMRFSYDLARRVENSKLAKDYVVTTMSSMAKKVDELVENDGEHVKEFVDCK